MEPPWDLYRGSREELVAVVVRLREQTTAQDQENTRLRAELDCQRTVTQQLQERIGRLLAILDPPQDDDPPSRPTTMPGL